MKVRTGAMPGLGLRVGLRVGLTSGVGSIFALSFAAYLEPSNAWRWAYLLSLCQ